jgi:hypothetical protein
MYLFSGNRWHDICDKMNQGGMAYFRTSCGMVLRGEGCDVTDDELLLGTQFCCASCFSEKHGKTTTGAEAKSLR